MSRSKDVIGTQFPLYVGYITGALSREDVRRELMEGGAKLEDIENLEKALLKIAEAFYRDKYK